MTKILVEPKEEKEVKPAGAGRLAFLKEKFNIVPDAEFKDIEKVLAKKKPGKRKPEMVVSGGDGEQNSVKSIPEDKVLKGHDGQILAVILVNDEGKAALRIAESVFDNIVKADPTPNKEYVQWMLTVFIRFIKEKDFDHAERFASEDLSQAKEYLEVFEKNKRKDLFKQVAGGMSSMPPDPANVMAYKDLSQLFRAVEPFVERGEEGQLQRDIKQMVVASRAEIPYEDQKWMVYVPLDTAANCVMTSYASWCTARPGNSMFESYTKNNQTPEKKNSRMFVVINKDVFKNNKCKEVFQFHFETDQYKDNANGQNISLFDFFNKNLGLKEFFVSILKDLAKKAGGNIRDNKYIKQLMSTGETDNLFEYIDINTDTLILEGFKIPTLPDISAFQNLKEINLNGIDLTELPPSIGNLPNLDLLTAANNKIKFIPKEIGKLKNLTVLNLLNNQITDVPNEIAQLDESNGGQLIAIAISADNNEKLLAKVKKLLPQTQVNS